MANLGMDGVLDFLVTCGNYCTYKVLVLIVIMQPVAISVIGFLDAIVCVCDSMGMDQYLLIPFLGE